MLPYEVGERSANICSESNIVRPNQILYSTSSLFHSCALLSTSLTSSLSLLFHTYAELSMYIARHIVPRSEGMLGGSGGSRAPGALGCLRGRPGGRRGAVRLVEDACEAGHASSVALSVFQRT